MSAFITLLKITSNIEVNEYKDESFEEYLISMEKMKNSNSNKITLYIYYYINEMQWSKVNNMYEFISLKHEKRKGYTECKFDEEMGKEFENNWYKAQKAYFAFIKMAQIYRYKKKPKVTIDLKYDEIEIKNKNTMKIHHEGQLYYFALSDLKKIIIQSLSNCVNYFAEPLYVKNPYNNVALTKGLLFNIYTKMISYNMVLELFTGYYKCEFDITIFKLNYENLIKEVFINRSVLIKRDEELFYPCRRMLGDLCPNRDRVDTRIEKKEFVKILRPYYYLYVVQKFHTNGLEKTNRSYNLLIKKIDELYSYNPKFGRFYVKRNPTTKVFEARSNLDAPEFTIKEAKECKYVCIDDIPSRINFNYNSDSAASSVVDMEDEEEESEISDIND